MIMMLIRIFLIIALIKLLIDTEKPLLCAGIYGAASFVLGLWGLPAEMAAIRGAIGFGLSFVYFWLLDKFEESGFFWVIMIVGIVIGFV